MLVDKISKRLGIDLTDDQKEAFNELKAKTRAAIEPLAKAMWELGRQMPEILLAEEINIVEAQEKLDQIVSFKCQIASIAANATLEGVQILTPEQRQIIKEKIEAWKNLCPWLSNL